MADGLQRVACQQGACDAARSAESPALLAHALVEQAVVLADIGRMHDGATMSTHR